MGAFTDQAFETDAVILNNTAGLYAGSSTPEIDAPDAPLGSRYYRSNGDFYIKTLDTGSGIASDWTFQPKDGAGDRVKWRNLWQAGTYEKNEMVRDGEWTMIANKQTTDRASPTIQGEPGFVLPDAPSWTIVNESTPRFTGARFTITADSVLVDGLRVWIENTDSNTEYWVQLIDITDSGEEKIFEAGPVDNSLPGWHAIEIGQRVFTAGQVFDARVFQLKQTPASEFTHPWTSLSHFSAPADPGSGNWARDAAFTTVTISKTDNAVVDQSTDLATLGVGDALNFAEVGDTRRRETCTIEGVTDQGTWIEYAVGLDFVEREIRSNRSTNVNGVNIGASSPIDIPRLINYWVDDSTINGFNSTTEAGITASLDENAYGVDLRFAPVDASDDWDLVAFLGSIPGTPSGGGSAGFPTDGRAIFVNGQWGYMSASDDQGVPDGTGLLATMAAQDAGSGVISDDTGTYFEQDSGAAVGNECNLTTVTDQTIQFNAGHWRFSCKFKLPNDIAGPGYEFFVGLKDTAGDLPGTGNIGQDGVGLHATEGDTNWQFLIHDGTTQFLSDSGVPITTDPFFVAVEWPDTTKIVTKIYDATFTLLATSTFNPPFPGVTQDLRFFIGRQNTDGTSGDRVLHTYYAAVHLEK